MLPPALSDSKSTEGRGVVANLSSTGLGLRRTTRHVWLLGLALAGVVLGAKWTLILVFGGETPFGDQWIAEVSNLYSAAAKQELGWLDLLKPHNEHRIVATNLLNLALFKIADDQMDPRIQASVSTALHALWFGLVGAWLAKRIKASFHPALFALLAILGVASFAYENTLWGFQSQIYFVLLFWAATAWGLCFHRFPFPGWWCGLVSGCLAVLSFGPGSLVGVAIIAVMLVRVWNNRRSSSSEIASIVVALLLVFCGFATRVAVEQHADLRAESWSIFSISVLQLMSWPANAGIPIGIFLWLPGGWLLLQLAGRKTPVSAISEAAVFTLTLAMVCIAATAVFRGHNVAFEGIAPRYLDLFALGVVGNFLGLILLVHQSGPRLDLRYAAMITWLVVVIVSLSARTLVDVATVLPFWRQSAQTQLARVGFFLNHPDSQSLNGGSLWEIGYPSPEKLAEILREPGVGRILPPALSEGVTKEFRFPDESRYKPEAINPAHPEPARRRTWGDWPVEGRAHDREPVQSLVFSASGGWALWTHAVSPERGRVRFTFTPFDGEQPEVIEASGDPTIPVWRESQLHLQSGPYTLSVVDMRTNGWSAVTVPRQISFLGLVTRTLLLLGPMLFLGSFLVLSLLLWWPLRAK